MRATIRSAGDLNQCVQFLFFPEEEVKVIPWASFEERRWPVWPTAGPKSPISGSTPPEPSRSGRAGGGGVSCPPRSLTEGQQDAAEAQHPQGPHGAWLVSLKSLLTAGAASAPPHPGARILTPLAARSAHYTLCRSGRFSPRLLAGGGRETRIHQSRRTTHPLHPMSTRGGDHSPPIGVVQVRCPMPEAWLLPIGLA